MYHYVLFMYQERGLTNVEVITCDINTFESKEAGTYDRVISIEMFEHMKNYQKLMKKVRSPIQSYPSAMHCPAA